jgi:hypothetical protein
MVTLVLLLLLLGIGLVDDALAARLRATRDELSGPGESFLPELGSAVDTACL